MIVVIYIAGLILVGVYARNQGRSVAAWVLGAIFSPRCLQPCSCLQWGPLTTGS